jgi:hypothetical protein
MNRFHTMSMNHPRALLAALLALVLSGCTAPDGTTSEFGRISTTNRLDRDEIDRNPSGRTSGIGFVHEY